MKLSLLPVLTWVLLLLLPVGASASQPKIDLSVERAEYEELQFNRTAGLAFVAAALAAASTCAYGYSSALAARANVQAEVPPFDLGKRESLVGQAQTGSALGIIGAVISVGTGVLSYYFLSRSFQ